MARDNELEEIYEPDQLILSDLINRVLDKGVVITANITISIADIDLIQLDLRLLISSVATLVQRQQVKQDKRDHLLVRPRSRK
jgi:gas vesicle structural protein